jgi:hypothetical protein
LYLKFIRSTVFYYRLIPLMFIMLISMSIEGQAYVISKTSLGDLSYWHTRCIPLWLSSTESANIDQTQVETELLNALEAWDQLNCTSLSFTYQGTVDSQFVGYDNTLGASNYNLVTFVSSRTDWLYDPAALALTTVTMCINETPECSAGTIVDADIEINESYHDFTTSADRPIKMDLANTLTHEVGHLIGLDHSPIFEATMYFQQPLGETIKRDLAEDDQMAVCSIFPLSDDRQCSLDPYQFITINQTDQGCHLSWQWKVQQDPLAVYLFVLLFGLLRFRATA